MSPEKNDLVELSYGSNFIDIAKIAHISNNEDEIVTFNIINKEKIILKKEELYLKEEIIGKSMCEVYQKQMKMLGAKNIWVRLTKNQYKKITKNKKHNVEKIKEIDDKQIEKLKKWFLENKDEEKKDNNCIDMFTLNKKEEEIDQNSINIFGEEKKNGPLSRFIKKNT